MSARTICSNMLEMMAFVAVHVSHAMRVPTLSKTCVDKRTRGQMYRTKTDQPRQTYLSMPFLKLIPHGSKTQHLIHCEEDPRSPARAVDPHVSPILCDGSFFSCRDPRGGSLHDPVYSAGFPFTLKVLTPSSSRLLAWVTHISFSYGSRR